MRCGVNSISSKKFRDIAAEMCGKSVGPSGDGLYLRLYLWTARRIALENL
jgi:hypothetical protein